MPAPSPYPTITHRHRRQCQAGSGTIEFAIAAVPILLLGFGCLELAQWFYVKQAISLALLDAARAGITQNANPNAIKTAFDEALRPLFPPTSGHTSARRVQARHMRLRAVGLAPWQIEILTPTPEAFTDFADQHLPISQQTGLRAVNNNYQKEQDQARRGLGWPQGAGPASGQTIYQANTLTLRLSYPHKPLTPGISALLRLLGADSPGYKGKALVRGYLPLSQEITLTMQSHPVDWPPLADGTVVSARQTAGPHGAGDGKCHGLWCFDAASIANDKSTGLNDEGSGRVSNDASGNGSWLTPGAIAEPPAATPENTPPVTEPWALGADTPADDPACGVILCCQG